MRFTVSTKPLKNVTNLGIIKANISKFYYRSNVVQITADQHNLKLNIEASGIKTKMVLSGSGDEDATKSIIVDCSMFKNLIDSIDSDIISIEFVDGGIAIHAGTSKFAIPQLLDTNDVQLNEPIDSYTATSTFTIKPTDWQFVKDHQMYAISASKEHPVYTNVWVGNDKGVIVGDFESSLFTYSKQGNFDSICLLPPSLINLFTSIPEGSTVEKIDRNYVLTISTDSYSMVTEFLPKYEDDDSVGSYNSGIILNMLNHPESFITVDVAPIIKFINQTSILNQTEVSKILTFAIEDGTLTLTNRSGRYSMEVESDRDYTVKFIIDMFKSVLTNMDSDKVSIAPILRQGTDDMGQPIEMAIGCIVWTDTITTVVAGQG